MSTLQENNNFINIRLFILDPLSVIIKLAILSNKPVGTKIYIQNNIIHFQEPGMFQAVCRYVLNTNKTDLQYMYNPIELACQHYLTEKFILDKPSPYVNINVSLPKCFCIFFILPAVFVYNPVSTKVILKSSALEK